MGRPTDWFVLDLRGDPVPGVPDDITVLAGCGLGLRMMRMWRGRGFRGC
jgi:hypothetical protein